MLIHRLTLTKCWAGRDCRWAVCELIRPWRAVRWADLSRTAADANRSSVVEARCDEQVVPVVPLISLDLSLKIRSATSQVLFLASNIRSCR